MVQKQGRKTAIVRSGELGTNCWHPRRFVTDGPRCERLFTCSYPEKSRCQAVNAELRHLRQEQLRLVHVYVNIGRTMKTLQNMVEK